MKLTVEQLDRKDIDWKAILKAEGAISNDNSQHKEWWDVFHLMMMCEKAGLSELEKWCVLKGRFELKRKCLKCNGDGWIYKNRITSEKTNCLCNPVCEHDFTEACFNRSDEFMYNLCSKCGEQQT